MAILVIQLARFGDIFQSWPALKALRRQAPSAKIHLLVRERFKDAALGAAEIGVVLHTLPTADILAPLITGAPDTDATVKLDQFVQTLKQNNFDQIINLSFSPFSSYLTEALAADGCKVSGYTRHADGYLKIPDDSSAYFYAQVGVGRHNRYHVTEIFAAVAGVDLVDADFSFPSAQGAKSNSVIIHLGASEEQKTYPAELWRDVLRELHAHAIPTILVGSASERPLSETVSAGLSEDLVQNRVGKSTLKDLSQWVNDARLVVGADSAPVQIAALTGTPVLNLSCASVNFWETGPMSAGSRVLFSAKMHEIKPVQIVNEISAMLAGAPGAAFAERPACLTTFKLNQVDDDFYWRMIQALYTAADYPPLPKNSSALGFQRLYDVADLAYNQLTKWREKGPDSASAAILTSVDEMLTQLPMMDPQVEPVVGWFQTERLRMGPAAPEATLARTTELFEQLRWIAKVYHTPAALIGLTHRATELARLCVPSLREFEFSQVNSHFQELLSVLQDLGRHTTKVGETNWSSVLRGLQDALEKRDLIELADTLEFDLPGWMESRT